jgi:dihydrofolate reductase
MTRVIVDISTSLDGFVSKHDDDPGPIHKWLFSGDRLNPHNDMFKTAGKSGDVLDEMLTTTGAVVAGKRTYDLTNGWNGEYPITGVPVFVVTHETPKNVPGGKTPFTFVNGVTEAVEQAREGAGDKNVSIIGGASIIQQALEAGVVDELIVHVVSAILGDGIRLIDKGSTIELNQLSSTDAPGVTHIRYAVKK